MRHVAAYLFAFAFTAAALGAVPSATRDPNAFRIQVVDDTTGRGVPLVELKTTHAVRYVTDSNGLVAFDEPGLMDQRVFFSISSHGYVFPRDGFGYAGTALDVRPGGSAVIKLTRRNLAERLYRITGAGAYRDSVLLGEPVPVREPLLNGGVLGQDSVQVVPYRGRLYWFWGDTTRASYPLGNFRTSGATSELPGRGGLDPAVGLDLTYFTNRDGFVKPMAPIAGEGPVWIDGLLTVADEKGRERLVAHYSRMKNLGHRLEHGLLMFDDAKAEFAGIARFDNDDRWRHPQNQSLRFRDGGEDYFYFLWPDRPVRVRADLAHLKNPAAYETFTCVASAPVGNDGVTLDRDAAGQLLWAWRTNAFPLSTAEERRFIDAGWMRQAEARFQFRDLASGKPIEIHTGTVNWNEFRKQWIMIGVQAGGASFLGEVWYAEADSPLGPWGAARKIATHDRYSFYNPVHHACFDQDGGRRVYFEGTYATTFSGSNDPTPRYDYNQILYRLDLTDSRLFSATRPAQ